MGRMYAVPISGTSVSAAVDLFELLAATDKPIKIHSIFISQSSDTDSEQLRLTLKRVTGAPTSGSGGSTPTPTPLMPNDGSAGFTAETCNTTQISGGTSAVIHEDSYNVLGGWVFMPTPEIRPVAAPGTRLVLSQTAPADALTINGVAYVEEML